MHHNKAVTMHHRLGLFITVVTYKANSSRRRRRYCFLGFMVLKSGSLMTSGHTPGQGLPHRRLWMNQADRPQICQTKE